MKMKTTALMTALMIAGLLISACGGSDAEATPTMARRKYKPWRLRLFKRADTDRSRRADRYADTDQHGHPAGDCHPCKCYAIGNQLCGSQANSRVSQYVLCK